MAIRMSERRLARSVQAVCDLEDLLIGQTIVSLLSAPSTPAGAKAEVKKLLQARNIRASIADSIITRIFNASAAATPISEVPPVLDDSTVGGTRSGAATPAGDEVPIVYVSSVRNIQSRLITDC
jgi:hypothetical protein